MFKSVTSGLEREGDICKVCIRMFLQMPAEVSERRIKRHIRSRGDSKQLGRAERWIDCMRRRFLQHHVQPRGSERALLQCADREVATVRLRG